MLLDFTMCHYVRFCKLGNIIIDHVINDYLVKLYMTYNQLNHTNTSIKQAILTTSNVLIAQLV